MGEESNTGCCSCGTLTLPRLWRGRHVARLDQRWMRRGGWFASEEVADVDGKGRRRSVGRQTQCRLMRMQMRTRRRDLASWNRRLLEKQKNQSIRWSFLKRPAGGWIVSPRRWGGWQQGKKLESGATCDQPRLIKAAGQDASADSTLLFRCLPRAPACIPAYLTILMCLCHSAWNGYLVTLNTVPACPSAEIIPFPTRWSFL